MFSQQQMAVVVASAWWWQSTYVLGKPSIARGPGRSGCGGDDLCECWGSPAVHEDKIGQAVGCDDLREWRGRPAVHEDHVSQAMGMMIHVCWRRPRVHEDQVGQAVGVIIYVSIKESQRCTRTRYVGLCGPRICVWLSQCWLPTVALKWCILSHVWELYTFCRYPPKLPMRQVHRMLILCLNLLLWFNSGDLLLRYLSKWNILYT